ncbi:MAG: type II CRISPR RNA-guided endonuclease Cas9, partial [Collinsella sp.]|nr:type II CRISPR RNA-guided endonuclease Cas9 [Collinsella sp.]
MKLRELDEYSIGFDLGTGSVGWAVITPDGELPRWKGRPVWGSRVFPTAATAADTRLKRGQRRRYVRRRWRLNILQELFLDEIKKVDAGFFDRLNQSRLLPSDRGFHSPLFNGSDLSEKEYYKRFPTMSHLRAWLMNTDGKADIRLVYLAFHNIVKHRGNFLQQDNKRLSARTVNIDDAINRLAEELALRGESIECAVAVDVPAAAGAFKEGERKRAAIASGVQESIRIEASEFKSTARVLGRALVGYKVDFSKMLMLEGVGLGSASLSDDDKVEEILSAVPDDCLPLFNAIYEVYSAYILMGILRLSEGELQTGSVAGMDGQTLSFCQVREYEKYGKDLATLKSLVNAYAPREYDSFFRGELYPGTRLYNKQTAKGYTRYNAVHKTDYENFAKDVAKLFEGTGAQEDERYRDMMQEFEERRFLRRQKTGDNGSIPYQLHLEEMNAIIENQGRHHPFLLDVRDKLTSLVTFRIPYYVGPLAKANAALDAKGSRRFSWAERLPGKEHEPIRPWNWDQVIDKNRAAHDFIMRMTNDCTYLFDEPVLPRCSLLYEEFCVLNELNGAWFVEDGDTKRRFNSFDDRYGIVEELFKNKRKVKFTDVANWLQRNGSAGPHVRVGGGQGEAGFESSLTSYRFFCKDVFHVDELDEAWVPMIEDIILWNTLFEDRKILKEELERNYGDRLTPEQIKTICKKRFTGWGKLSKKFLQGLKAKTDNGPKSIMDVLREGGQMASGRMRAMVLMEVLHDDGLGFQELIERENLSKLPATGELQVEDLPGSPSVRRTVNQAMRILDEITRIVGKPPVNVFVEVTRDEGDKRRTTRRYDQVKKAVMALGTEYGELKRELKDREPKAFDDERLMLYFLQGGKCLYSGTALDINLLSEYEVDHIIPQAYIKDDSLENKALVLSKYNQAKTDHLLISPAIRQSQCVRWAELRRAGMMGEKKYNNLMRSEISDKKMKGFIARQLVETSQSIKLFQMMIQNHYPDCRIVPVRARLSSELREVKDY